MHMNDLISIGQLAQRTGLSVSAIRFYETKGLVTPMRNSGGQRRFLRPDIRRLSFVLIAQQLGLPLREIETVLSTLPKNRTPTQKDWTDISKSIRSSLDDQIAKLQRTRQNLDGCIGCGCLSLKKCKLYNANDRASEKGPGPQYLLRERTEGD